MKTKPKLYIPFSWEERKAIFLERFFYVPKHYSVSQEPPLDWADERLFGERSHLPLCVELCSGNGQWIGTKARERPECNWVAVEMKFERARKIWLKRERESLANVYVVCAEAAQWMGHFVPAGSVAEVYINFPDPWPKGRHAKHRLIQPPFVESLSRAVIEGGKVTVVTDHSRYREQIEQVFGQNSEWAPLPLAEPDLSYGDSFFRTLWASKGLSIHYLRYAYGSRVD